MLCLRRCLFCTAESSFRESPTLLGPFLVCKSSKTVLDLYWNLQELTDSQINLKTVAVSIEKSSERMISIGAGLTFIPAYEEGLGIHQKCVVLPISFDETKITKQPATSYHDRRVI